MEYKVQTFYQKLCFRNWLHDIFYLSSSKNKILTVDLLANCIVIMKIRDQSISRAAAEIQFRELVKTKKKFDTSRAVYPGPFADFPFDADKRALVRLQ